MKRQLLDWFQIHPSLDRIEAHTGQAIGENNYEIGRGWDPAHVIPVAVLDDALAVNRPSSTAEFLAIVSALVADMIDMPVSVLEPAQLSAGTAVPIASDFAPHCPTVEIGVHDVYDVGEPNDAAANLAFETAVEEAKLPEAEQDATSERQ